MSRSGFETTISLILQDEEWSVFFTKQAFYRFFLLLWSIPMSFPDQPRATFALSHRKGWSDVDGSYHLSDM